MKTIILTIILFSLNSVQYKNYKLIEKQDLKRAFILNSSPTFLGYFYQGSDNDFHYFVSKWQLQKDRYFKLNVAYLKLNKTSIIDLQEIKIELLSNKDSIEFGHNKYYKLYIVD